MLTMVLIGDQYTDVITRAEAKDRIDTVLEAFHSSFELTNRCDDQIVACTLGPRYHKTYDVLSPIGGRGQIQGE